MNILIVDDSASDRALAYRALRAAFPDSAVHLINSAEAFERFEELSALDLVVTDWDVKHATGRRIIAAVKRQAPSCPVIVFTGSLGDRLDLAISAGADECVLKSAGMDQLAAAARRQLRR